MLQQEFALIHCHTPVAGVLTRFAARALRGKGCRIIYTAHGFHFFKGAPFVNWLVFYTAEWICSWLTDVLITINKEDYFLAKKRFHAKEIQYVPGVGVNTDKINLCNPNKKIIRRNLGLSDDEKMIVSVGELNSNKNHEAVIRALGKIADTRIHYFIAGNGELGEYLKEIANEVGINNNFHLLGYRTDVIELNMTADLYCHPSYREGLSVALMEAIAAGTRVACSDIRGNRDLAEDCANVVLFDPHNIDNIASVIVSSMNRDVASNDGIEKYSLNVVQERMRTIYCSEK